MTSLVVIDADTLGRQRTGDETFVRGVIGGFAEIGPTEPLVMAATRDPDQVPEGVATIQVGPASQLTRLGVRLPLALRRHRADLLHAHYFVPPAWRGPSVVTVHDISFEVAPLMPAHDREVMRRWVPYSMRRARAVVTISEASKQDIVDVYDLDPHKVAVVYGGVEPDARPEGPRCERSPYVLFVGGMNPRKDPLTAVRALARLDPSIGMVVTGPGGSAGRAVRSAIDELGLSARVDIAGYQPRERLMALYRGALCLVFPSRHEGFGLPVLEAMACGTPVVAASTTSIPEVAGDAAVLVPPGEPKLLADGIEHALDHRDELMRRGLQRAAHFSWERSARQLLGIYRRAIR